MTTSRTNTKLWLKVSHSIFDTQIEELTEYARMMERLIAKEASEIGSELDRAASGLNEDDRSEFYADNSDYFQLVSNTFPNRLRLSCITLLYTILETRVIRVAKFLGSDAKLKLNDLSGSSPLEKAQKYLTSVLDVDSDSDSWSRLKPWAKIRNVVAHANGRTNENDLKQLKSFLQQNKTAIHLEGAELVATEHLVPAFIQEVESFHSKLSAALAKWESSRSAP